MNTLKMPTRAVLAAIALMAGLAATTALAEPKVKVLSAPEDPTQKTILVGRSEAGGMVILFELEPAKSMWMPMGQPPRWTEHSVGKGELYHVEVKPIDPRSKTRISYAEVAFTAVNRDNGKKVQGALHPMWGGSGLHYSANSALAGDGVYDATITVGVPMFARDPKDTQLWMQPATTKFHFRLANGKLIEVSEPMN